ncbi:MBL fold metallo-hydrolase [Sphingobacterium psychroaquaticum]|uniref:Glyoxylase, beta-lactamase superfamily II n=1 Tax=Sphingobacterium psychroaquaticum TaxID=561061 RepID=A0A1X7KX33_9SPHI|nr:MBL fold metallo-hydrolase [Sphingobacterium psychroaquaticum]QBQ39663.1 MBL fold metallo-hydrolase [Sphingobacterium psychroaquaticum]SMG46116.1 Glyoxylase, beta-lactamase superfamily II [Sphingobacterium psychroaquaticum]
MLKIQTFTFNPFQENTYIVYDEIGNCAIFDPGTSSTQEEQELTQFITDQKLTPVALVNTHCHVDHVLGNRFIFEQYGLMPQLHEGEVPTLVAVQNYAPMYGIRYEVSPIPEAFLQEGSEITIGSHILKTLFVPGHSPAHLCFYSADYGFLIGGDVLFRNSIGRTDLPGGNHQLLLDSIKKEVYTLPDNTVVYPGHGPTTTVGYEKETNPFVRG